MLLLAQGWTDSATAEPLERDPDTIGRWTAAFGEGGPAALIFEQTGGSPPDRGRYFRAMLMTLISDGARSMIFEPENSALARSQGPEEPVLDSCKFQGFVAKFSRYLPLSGFPP